MTAVWMRVRAEFRSRLLAVLILGLLIGLAGGAVLAAATGARRTQTAYPRFVEAQRGLLPGRIAARMSPAVVLRSE